MMDPSPPFKVCYFIKRYPRLSQTFILNEMLELRRQGIDIAILALKDSGEEIVHEKCRELDAPIYYLPHPKDHATLIQTAFIAPLLKSLKIDHIHAHFATSAATTASCVSGLTGIPFSFTAHARDIYYEKVNKKELVQKIEKAKFVVTVSDFNKRYLEELMESEGRRGKIIRLYNGIDLDLFKPSDDEEEEPNLVVGVGRLVQKKGFTYLIQACKILKERGKTFHCVIIGEGEERDMIEKQVAEYSLEKDVSLLGARMQTEVIQIVRRSSVFVLPCVVGNDGDRDGLPTVLLEATALGVPVISTTVTGVPEIVQHERTGLLVEQKNPRALAAAIERLLDSRGLQERLRRNALTKVRKEFNLTDNVRKLKGHFLSGGRTA